MGYYKCVKVSKSVKNKQKCQKLNVFSHYKIDTFEA
jgi:hypothetical protein